MICRLIRVRYWYESLLLKRNNKRVEGRFSLSPIKEKHYLSYTDFNWGRRVPGYDQRFDCRAVWLSGADLISNFCQQNNCLHDILSTV